MSESKLCPVPYLTKSRTEDPLRGVNDAELEEDVTKMGLDDDTRKSMRNAVPLARYRTMYASHARAAANDPAPPWTLPVELSDEEKKALRDEEHGLFKQPRDMILTIIVCAIAALVQYV